MLRKIRKNWLGVGVTALAVASALFILAHLNFGFPPLVAALGCLAFVLGACGLAYLQAREIRRKAARSEVQPPTSGPAVTEP